MLHLKLDLQWHEWAYPQHRHPMWTFSNSHLNCISYESSSDYSVRCCGCLLLCLTDDGASRAQAPLVKTSLFVLRFSPSPRRATPRHAPLRYRSACYPGARGRPAAGWPTLLLRHFALRTLCLPLTSGYWRVLLRERRPQLRHPAYSYDHAHLPANPPLWRLAPAERRRCARQPASRCWRRCDQPPSTLPSRYLSRPPARWPVQPRALPPDKRGPEYHAADFAAPWGRGAPRIEVAQDP